MLNFLKVNFINRKKIWIMAIMDLKKMYAGSFLGLIWIILKHLIIVFVFWFTFYIGLRGSNYVEGIPYFIWLIVGLAPWFFINDGLTSGAQTMLRKAYIIKKIKFQVEIFPIINTTTNLISHLMFLLIIFFLLVLNGFVPGLFEISLIYYLFATFIFLWVTTILTSSVSVLIRDVPYLVQSITSALLWLSPILWPFTNLPYRLQLIMRFNPLHYLVNGYRNALLFHDISIFASIDTIIFWTEILLIYIISILTFKKIRPILSDML